MTGTIYQGYIKDSAGNIIEGASVEVRDQDTNTVVTIWSDRATLSTKTNPTLTDANGYFFFYRTAGRYKITVTSATYNATFNNVPIGNAMERDIGSDAGDIPLISQISAVGLNNQYASLTGLPTLGTMAALDTGTAAGQFRTNSQNDGHFLRITNNLSDVVSATARANLGLGTAATTAASDYATAAQGATADTALQPATAIAVLTIDTGQGAVECYAMDQAVATTSAVTFAQINADNIRIDGNTISSTNTDGNITIDPNGTGPIELVGATNVTGAISATTQIKPGSYTVATLPTATGAGAIIYVSDETGGATIAFSDGTNWRRVSDRAIVA